VNERCVSLSDVRESVPHHRLGASSHSTTPYSLHTLPVDDCVAATPRCAEMCWRCAEMCRDVPRCAAWCLASVREPFQHTYFISILEKHFPVSPACRNINLFEPLQPLLLSDDVRNTRFSYFPGHSITRCSRCILNSRCIYFYCPALRRQRDCRLDGLVDCGAGACSVVRSRWWSRLGSAN